MVLVVAVTALGLLARHSAHAGPSTGVVEVVGQVDYPGWYPVESGASVADAVAMAGGVSQDLTLLEGAIRVRVHEDGRARVEPGAP